MNRYSLLNSVQAGSFTNTNRHIDFLIPEGVYDMSQCFVQLICRLVTASTEVHNMVLRNTITSITPKNIDLIRNCWLSGDKVGRLEDISRVNVLQSNMFELTKSTSEKIATIDSLYQVRDYEQGLILSPFVQMYKDGSVASSYRDVYLRIPLSQLFSLGSLTALDVSKTGRLTVHVEIENLSYLEFVEAKLFKDPALAEEGKMNNVLTNTNQITTKAYDASTNPNGIIYESLEQSPYFVGQKLLLSALASVGANLTNQVVTVLAIVHNVVQKTITLTLDYTFQTTSPVVEWTGINVVEKAVDLPATLSIANANLGVAEVMGAKGASPDVLEYLTFTSEQFSNNSSMLEKVFEVEASAVNAFLLFNNNTSNMISNNKKVNDYRMRIGTQNGQYDVYDRNIRVNYENDGVLCHDALHYDAINRAMVNAGLPLKNLTMLNMARNAVALASKFKVVDGDQNILILATPLPLTPMSKTLQFSVSTKAPEDRIENVILFKQVLRTVKLM